MKRPLDWRLKTLYVKWRLGFVDFWGSGRWVLGAVLGSYPLCDACETPAGEGNRCFGVLLCKRFWRRGSVAYGVA